MSATTMSHLADYKSPSISERLRPLRSPWRAFRRRLLRKPGSTMAMLIAALSGGVIITNALALQTERHPSPLFTALNEPRSATEVVADAIPMPPARPSAERRGDATVVAAAKGARTVKEEPQRTASITPKEQMLAIIKGGAPDVAPAEPGNRMVLVQRALNKAGYGPLKEDGAFGAGSRQALERFEADRRLPVRGEPQGKTLRELARASGIQFE